MIKLILAITFLFFVTLIPFSVSAKSDSFISVVNPIRGRDFWEDRIQDPKTVVFGQIEILDKFAINATYLFRYDALFEREIIDKLKNLKEQEKGIFLEITPTFAKDANVLYHASDNWHAAGSAFLSGYEREERIKFIDTAFEKFREIFGTYPKSIGAWWIDAFSLSYMQEKYGVVATLIVADQYTTDNYQIWGQFWSTPYYPAKNNALHPAQNLEDKLPVVITQWAARDPVNAYGKGVSESTFSVQANDYVDYHNLDTNYFSTLVDIYTKQPLNEFGQLTVGLENSYSWEKYGGEYEKQIKVLAQKANQGQFSAVTMEDFASWYKNKFPGLSPSQVIVADDPLGSFKKAVWFMNPYYRIGWFSNEDGSVIRDIRQYIDGEVELCYVKRCDEVNFGTSATRVLDEVSFGHKYLLDSGRISDFKVTKEDGKYVVVYKNEAGSERTIEFLPRDISVDKKISTIDSLILDKTFKGNEVIKPMEIEEGFFKWSPISSLFNTFKFLLFLIIGCLVPGYLLMRGVAREGSFVKQVTTATILGFVLISLLSYILGLLNLKPLIFLYLLINFIIFIKLSNFFKKGLDLKIRFGNLPIVGLILVGTIFQQLPTFKNGLIFSYGMGFWGPNTHDGMWHVALINQLVKSTPPQNPIFAGDLLKNYHYFYDLLVAVTNYVSGIPILDLVFRFYPITFSILLGAGTYCFMKYVLKIKEKFTILASLYLVYFAGSFGWIVEFIKKGKFLGGESAFWANQSISFNLNPPFAVSLLIIIAIFLTLPSLNSKRAVVLISIFSGSLIAFKAYGAVLALIAFFLVGVLKRNLYYVSVFFLALFLSLLLFLPNFTIGQKLITFSPFWFIHSMIDSPDRVGWVRLSLARTTGLEGGNWFKFVAAETVSLLIFLVGNLGIRVFALLSLAKIKYIVRHADFLFIFLFSILAFIIPTLFIQVGNPWNTIQFLYYFLYVAAVLGGIVFARAITRLRGFAIIAMLIFLIITPISSWSSAKGYLAYQPHALISNEELEALEFLRSEEEGTVLTYPYNTRLRNILPEPWPIVVYDSTAYVSALAQKAVFVEDEAQNRILLTDYQKRLVAAKDFFTNPYANGKQFLKQKNIKYIYLPRIYKLTLDEQELNVKVIFENQQVYIYGVY